MDGRARRADAEGGGSVSDRDAQTEVVDRLRRLARDSRERDGRGCPIVTVQTDEIVGAADALAAALDIIRGQTTPPTDEQIAAHLAPKFDGSTGSFRGSWLITGEYGGAPMVRRDVKRCQMIAEEQRVRCCAWVWVALDRWGRPCARREVTT